MKLWRTCIVLLLVAWVVIVFGFGYWSEVRDNWPMAVVMVLGSLVAGSTPMGGGAVAFPIIVLVFGHSPHSARNFGLIIQALGMTSALLFIFGRKIPIQRYVLWWTTVGAAAGMTLGTFLVVPLVSRNITKLLFACLWMSFALLTLVKNREMCALDRRSAIEGPAAARTGLIVGLIGSTVASLIGVGVEATLYIALVLLYRSDLKVAVPTAVCAAAITSLFGAAIHVALGDISREVFLWWLAAVPIVIFGAPCGAYLVTRIARLKILYIVSLLCVVQFVSTLQQVAPSATEWLFVAITIATATTGFYALYRRGKTAVLVDTR